MSTIKDFAGNYGFKVADVAVMVPNNIIFKKTVGKYINFIEDDGKFFQLDLKTNEALELTPKSVAKQAEKDLKACKRSSFVSYIEGLGYIQKISFKKNTKKACEQPFLSLNIQGLVRDFGFKVTDVSVLEQNQVIFQTKAIPSMVGLVEDSGKYYQIDEKNNTATLVNPNAIKEQAEKDLMNGKFNTDAVCVAEQFWLIDSITFEKKDD